MNRENADSIGVLYVMDSFYHLGGAEGALLKILKHLPRERYRPHLLVLKANGPLERFLDPFPCPYEIWPLSRLYHWRAIPLGVRLFRFLRERNVRLVHSFYEIADFWAGGVTKLSRSAALVSSRRDMGITRTNRQSLAYRWLGNMFDQVQTVSNEVRRFVLEADGLDEDRVVTIHNGVDLDRVHRRADPTGLRSKFGIPDATHVVVCTANIRHVKGIDLLVRAAEVVCRQLPKAAFLVFGASVEDTYHRHIVKLIGEYGLTGRFILAGVADDIPSILTSSDVFVLPSRSEGMSNSLLEAMACALPCVATMVGGNMEVISDGQSGLLAPTEDWEAIAGQLIRVLSDPVLASRLGDTGRCETETRFSTAAMISKITAQYDKILALSAVNA